MSVDILWSLNIPELLGLPDFGLDDADTDPQGNIFVSDGVNGRVYRIEPGGSVDAFSVSAPVPAGEEKESSLNLAADDDAGFYVADSPNDLVHRHDDNGSFLGAFPAPGILSLCRGPGGLIYLLSSDDGCERIEARDQLGSLVSTLPAPVRYRAHLDPGLTNLDSDPDGNVYVTYGMPPYQVWKVYADGSGMDVWRREIDYLEDAVLISDLAFEPQSRILWVLLACKDSGRQLLDAFSPDGVFLGSVPIPHSDSLYGVVCSSKDSGLYLVETGSGPGSGDLVRISCTI